MVSDNEEDSVQMRSGKSALVAVAYVAEKCFPNINQPQVAEWNSANIFLGLVVMISACH